MFITKWCWTEKIVQWITFVVGGRCQILIPTELHCSNWSIVLFYICKAWMEYRYKHQWNYIIHSSESPRQHTRCLWFSKNSCLLNALSDLVNVSLDRYINQNTKYLVAGDQGDDATCYAFVAATVIHLSIHRIIGREDGWPDFNIILHNIIRCYWTKSASTLNVLKHVCRSTLRKPCKQLQKKQPVVATYRLTDDQRQIFSDFFYYNKKGILSKEEIHITKRSKEITPADLSGHVVVLTSFNADCLRLMSSLGDEWANGGFFRVKNAEVLNMQFIDVFWESIDLTCSDETYYKDHGKKLHNSWFKTLLGYRRLNTNVHYAKSPLLSLILMGLYGRQFVQNATENFPVVMSATFLQWTFV